MSGTPHSHRTHAADLHFGEADDSAALHAVLDALRTSPQAWETIAAGTMPSAARIGEEPGANAGDGWSVAVLTCVQRAYSRSIVLEVGPVERRHRLFAKVIFDHVDDSEFRVFGEGVARERAGLLAAAQVAGPADPVIVPRLLGFDASARIVLMDHVEGETLDRRLAAARWLGGSRRCLNACAALVRVGRWLSRFQQATVEMPDGVDRVNWWIGRCDRLLGEVESRIGACVPRGDRNWSRRVIERLDYLGWQLPAKLPLVACHGDLGPWNVLVGDQHVSVVDYAAFHADLPTMDVANMVTYLEYLEASMSYRREWLVRFRQAFLRGYQGGCLGDARGDAVGVADPGPLDSRLGQFSLHCHRVSRLHDAVFGTPRGPCAGWRRRRLVERQLARLLDAWV
jgi:tRNA A-37 threonylcarbamoyl transferase component Bud32